jgi:hypothetical protein
LAKVVCIAEAERRLLKIRDHIAVDNPVTAFKVVKSIYQQGPDRGAAKRLSSYNDDAARVPGVVQFVRWFP